MSLKQILTDGPSTSKRISIMQQVRKIKEDRNEPSTPGEKVTNGFMWLATILILAGGGGLGISTSLWICGGMMFLGFLIIFVLLIITIRS